MDASAAVSVASLVVARVVSVELAVLVGLAAAVDVFKVATAISARVPGAGIVVVTSAVVVVALLLADCCAGCGRRGAKLVRLVDTSVAVCVADLVVARVVVRLAVAVSFTAAVNALKEAPAIPAVVLGASMVVIASVVILVALAA